MEVDSVGYFEKQIPYDCGETSVKIKKKKPKNMGSGYDQGWKLDSIVLGEHETKTYLKGQNPRKNVKLIIHSYASRYLIDSRSHGISSHAEAPTTPDKIFDSGTVEMSWEEHITEESLFYTVPHTAKETYRKSIESHFLQCYKTCSNIQEVETSIYDAGAEFGFEEVAYDEDEGECFSLFHDKALGIDFTGSNND